MNASSPDQQNRRSRAAPSVTPESCPKSGLATEEHPYEVPGISTRTITDGNPDYLAWIAQETAPERA